MERCSRCKAEKPDEEFAWRRRARGQRDTYCRPCRAAYKQEHYRANRQRYIDAAARRKKALLEERFIFLMAYFRDHPCVDCSETDPIVLEFDHLRDKKFSISKDLQSGIDRTCSTRLQSARWFVQTVIDAAPQYGVASSARR
jgi:hypothetical protein